jgi:probable addiction module antidote protein
MEKKIKASDLPDFDVAEYLADETEIAEYLKVVIEDGDPDLLAATLGDIARARGMNAIAKEAGIGRESLYKALRPGAKPRFETIAKVCAALGAKLTVVPAHRPA